MIGSRVLNLSALLAFVRRESFSAHALTLVVEIAQARPEALVGIRRTRSTSTAAHPVPDVLLSLPVSVADDLDARRAREIGHLLRGRDARIDIAHAAVCSVQRSWPLVTAEAEAYPTLDVAVEIDPLPWPRSRRFCRPHDNGSSTTQQYADGRKLA